MSMTTRNRTFTTDDGRMATVWQERKPGEKMDGFVTVGRCVRTWVTVEGDDHQFECEPGCSFQAERVVREAMSA